MEFDEQPRICNGVIASRSHAKEDSVVVRTARAWGTKVGQPVCAKCTKEVVYSMLESFVLQTGVNERQEICEVEC